jgi:hypothetical protein
VEKGLKQEGEKQRLPFHSDKAIPTMGRQPADFAALVAFVAELRLLVGE